ncbi:MAG: hypothetical protein AAGD09_03625 [Cyanobacteria bacterium P01_F01_bin.56]
MPLSERQFQLQASIIGARGEIRDAQAISTSRRTSRPRINQDGTITRDGGTSERAQGNTGNRTTRPGTRVSESGGEVIGQSGANNGQLLADLRATQQQLIDAINTIPTRIINGNPNAQDPELLPQYLDDLVYDQASGTLFYWWADLEGDPPNPQWIPLRQLFQSFTGDPNNQSGSAIPIYIDGALAIRNDRTKFVGIIGGLWQGETEEIRGYIPATENGTIELGGTNSYALKVVAVRKSGSSAATFTTSPGIDSTVAAGSQLTLTTANADGSAAGFTVELERV